VVDEPVALDGDVKSAVVVCTLGMHRSGTSLVSRMLNLLGVHLGPDAPISRKGADNPKGYWEHDAFVAIDDEILARLGGRWDEPPALPASWPSDPRLADLREKARNVLATDFASAPLWGWKDPRTCLTLPFWQDVVGPMRYVLCVRNPLAVVGSLTRRNDMSAEKADELWTGHVRASLAHTDGHPRVLVFYEDVLDDWRRELRRLAAFVERPERADEPSVRDAVAAFVETRMCHHRPSMEDLVRDRRLSHSIKTLYLDLLLRSRESEDDRFPVAAPSTASHPLASREKLYLRSIARLEATVQDMALDRDGLVRETHLLRHTLDAVHESAAGRLVAFARSMLAVFLPPGTRRRQAFTAAVGYMASRLPGGSRPRKVLDPRTS